MNERTISQYKAALNKHQTFIKKFKIFPDKSRKAIYAQLLQLPLNHSHFIELTKPYPLLPEHTIDKQVSFIVSAFCKLYPDLGNQWLPGLIHPFVRLFKEDAIAGFQVSLTFILNWFRPMFEDYPNSSKDIMLFFSRHLKKLQKKVNSFDYPLSAIIQPLLLVALTDILNKEQTLQVYDYLTAHPYSPQLYLCIAVTIVSKVQDKLCTLETIEDIALCLRKQKKLNIQEIISQAAALSKDQVQDLNTIYSKIVFPLSAGRYPVCQFIHKIDKPTNDKLLKTHEQEMNRIHGKYQKLQSLVKNTLKENQVNYIEDVNKKYSDVQGQMRQYLKQVQEEHYKKLQIIRNLQNHFKDQINNHDKNRQMQYEKELKAIQRRGTIERQIQLIQQEAKSIRQAQREMLKRIEELSIAKKEQMIRRNAQLRYQQRLF